MKIIDSRQNPGSPYQITVADSGVDYRSSALGKPDNWNSLKQPGRPILKCHRPFSVRNNEI